MNLLQETIAEFGRSMGMDKLRLSEQGNVVLAMQDIGTLCLETAGPRGDEVLVSLTRSLPRALENRPADLLAATHFHHRLKAPMQVAVLRDQLVFAVVVPTGDLTLPTIYALIHVLDEQHRSIGERT